MSQTNTDTEPKRWLQPFVYHSMLEVVLLALLLLIWMLSGKSAVEKAVTNLVMPVGIIWIGLAHLMIHGFVHGRRLLWVPTLSLFVILTICGNAGFSSVLMQSLESKYWYAASDENEKYDLIVLLGGAVGMRPDETASLNANGDRIAIAASLYHEGRVQSIVCTGARIANFSTLKKDEAQLSKELLVSLGVPKDRIQLLGGRNTHEEMLTLAKSIGEGDRIGLVTSAWHMNRALRLAEDAGLTFNPLPGDFRSGPNTESTPLARRLHSLIPSSSALDSTSKALREFLATIVNR